MAAADAAAKQAVAATREAADSEAASVGAEVVLAARREGLQEGSSAVGEMVEVKTEAVVMVEVDTVVEEMVEEETEAVVMVEVREGARAAEVKVVARAKSHRRTPPTTRPTPIGRPVCVPRPRSCHRQLGTRCLRAVGQARRASHYWAATAPPGPGRQGSGSPWSPRR